MIIPFSLKFGAFISIVAVDILLIGNNEAELQVLKLFQFRIKDLDALHFFLGMEVIGEPNGLIISQKENYSKLITRA